MRATRKHSHTVMSVSTSGFPPNKLGFVPSNPSSSRQKTLTRLSPCSGISGNPTASAASSSHTSRSKTSNAMKKFLRQRQSVPVPVSPRRAERAMCSGQVLSPDETGFFNSTSSQSTSTHAGDSQDRSTNQNPNVSKIQVRWRSHSFPVRIITINNTTNTSHV